MATQAASLSLNTFSRPEPTAKSGMQVEQGLLDLHTGRPLTERDYTRCCISTFHLLMMSTCLLETCRGVK